jgi:hypothetical protein
LLPGAESALYLLAIGRGRQPMSSGAEVLSNGAVRRKELWGVPCQLKSPHPSLTTEGRLVGVFPPVVEIAVLPMLQIR